MRVLLQAEVTFACCRVLFALSSFPFLLFMVSVLRTLFTHTSPTGYTRRGECVPLDTAGLSNYLGWLRSALHPWRSVRRELRCFDQASRSTACHGIAQHGTA